MFHRAIRAHSPPRKPQRAANHQQTKSVQRDFVDDKIHAFVKQRIGRLAPEGRCAVMLDADQDGANEQRKKSPKQHSMRKARLRPRTAQGALGKGAGADVLECFAPIDGFVVRPTAPPEFDSPPNTPSEHSRRHHRQRIKNRLGRLAQVSKNFTCKVFGHWPLFNSAIRRGTSSYTSPTRP